MAPALCLLAGIWAGLYVATSQCVCAGLYVCEHGMQASPQVCWMSRPWQCRYVSVTVRLSQHIQQAQGSQRLSMYAGF